MRDVLSAGAEDSKRKTVNLLSLKTFGAVSAIGLVAAASCFAEQTTAGVHTVAGGDSPSSIASRYGVTIADIRRLNPDVNLGTLVIGAKIRVAPAGVYIVASGDSLSSIASRYGLTNADINRLNPGISFARLEIGSHIRVGSAGSGRLLAIRPGVSAGPGGMGTGPSTPEKERIRAQIERNKAPQRQALLRAEEARRRRYRTFGDCTYDWQGWGKSPSGIRSTTASCGRYSRIELAVDCKALKVSKRSIKYSKSSWSGWANPYGHTEDVVVELCGNL